ncbi:hypothetical protein HDU97_009322 [Phlyctochytrium planicorne]|nr:hypothetical protein HDU97_009322 [Phlyctochytrium planicorne]
MADEASLGQTHSVEIRDDGHMNIRDSGVREGETFQLHHNSVPGSLNGNDSMDFNGDADEEREDASTSVAGTDIQDDLLEHQTVGERVSNTAFSLMYFIIQGKPPLNMFLHGVAVVVEDLQLLSFFFSSELAYAYLIPDGMTTFFRLQPGNFTVDDFRTRMAIAYAPVFALIALFGWIALGYLTGRQKAGFGLTIFKIMALLLPSVFFIPIVDLTFVSIDCNTDRINAIWENAPDSFSALNCANDNRVSAILISMFVLGLFVPISLGLSGIFLDFNPTQKTFFSKINGRVDMQYLLLKVFLLAMFKFLDNNYTIIKAVTATGVCLAMFLLYLYYLPYYNNTLNQIRGGFYAAGAVMGIVSIIGTIYQTVSGGKGNYSVLSVMEFALVIGYIGGFIAIGKLYSYIQTTVKDRLDLLVDYSNDDEDLLVYPILPHVEVAARQTTQYMTSRNRRFNEKNIPAIKKLFSRGAYEFPSEANIRIPYAIYLFFINCPERDVNIQLAKARALKPAWDFQFQIFCISQISTQNKELDYLGLGVKLDIAGQAEYKKLDRDAKVNHYLAVQEMRNMWKFAKQKNFDVEELSIISSRLFTHAKRAHECYMRLAAKFPRSKLILRFFAQFCHDVTNDTARADALIFRADEIESQEQSMMNGVMIDDEVMVSPKMLKSRSAMEMKPQRVASASSYGVYMVPGPGPIRAPAPMPSEHRNNNNDEFDVKSVVRSEQPSFTKHKDQAKKFHRRARLARDALQVRVILVCSTIAVTALLLTAFFNLNTIWVQYSQDFKIIQWLEDRTYYTTMLPRRLRQLQASTDLEEFQGIQLRVAEEMKNLSSAHYNLFKSDQTVTKSGYAADFLVNSVVSNYPATTESIFYAVNLFSFTSNYIKSGVDLSSASFDDLRLTSQNNDIRFNAYDVIISGGFLDNYWDSAYSATSLVIGVTAATAFVIVCSFISVDLALRRFYIRQAFTLEVFRYLPKALMEEMINSMAESESGNIFNSNIAKLSANAQNTTWLSSVNAFRVQYISFKASLMALSILFGFLNVQNLFKCAEVMSVLHAVSEYKAHCIRSSVGSFEILSRDTRTWANIGSLLENYDHAVGTLVEVFNDIRFGNEADHIPAYTSLPKEAIELLERGTCLPFDTSLCCPDCVAWNETIGLTPTLVSSGLFHISTVITETHNDLLRAYANGIPPDPIRFELVQKTLEPFVLDGWKQIQIIIIKNGEDLYKQTITANYTILGFELLLLVVGFALKVFFTERLLSRYRFADQCLFDMFMKLPVHVRRMPQIAMILGEETGDMHEKKTSGIP